MVPWLRICHDSSTVNPISAATTERIVIDRNTGLAISGFDPVAYFTDAQALPGKSEFEQVVAGTAWRFRNAGNRAAFLADPDVYMPRFGGYDPVAYFATGKPTPGLAQFSTTYKGATYRFASAENRDRFIAAPEKFVPQYGGYCALAISLNKIADIDPEEWAIIKDKLYMNHGVLAQTLWSFDKSGNIARGDQNWPLVPKLGNP